MLAPAGGIGFELFFRKFLGLVLTTLAPTASNVNTFAATLAVNKRAITIWAGIEFGF